MSFIQKLKSIRNSGLYDLVIGSVIAAGIPIITIPIITRIFDPGTSGQYAIYLNCIMLMSPLCSIQFEHIMFTFRRSRTVKFLTGFLIYCVPVISIFVFLAFFFLVTYTNIIDVSSNLVTPILMYLSVSSLVFYAVTAAYLTYMQDYTAVKRLEITRAMLVSFIPISAYFLEKNPSENSLLLGFCIGNSYSMAVLLKKYGVNEIFDLGRQFQFSRFVKILRNRIVLSLYSMTSNLLNFISQYAQVVLVGISFGPLAAGIFSMGHRLVMMPVSFLSPPIYRYFISLLGDSGSRIRIGPVFLMLLSSVSIVCVVVSLLFYYLVIPYVHVLLGEEWRQSSTIMYPILFVSVARLLSAPFSGVLVSEQKQKFELLINCALTAGIFWSVYVSSALLDYAYNVALVQSSVYAIALVYYIYLIRRISYE